MERKLYRQYTFKLRIPDDEDVIGILDAQKSKTSALKQALRVWNNNKPQQTKDYKN